MSILSGLKNIFVKDDEVVDYTTSSTEYRLPIHTTNTTGTLMTSGTSQYWNYLANEESAELVQLEKQREEMVKALRLKDFKSNPAKDRETLLSTVKAHNVINKLEADVATELDARIAILNNKRSSFMYGHYATNTHFAMGSDITNRLKNINLTIEDLEKAHLEALLEEELGK